MVTIGHCDHRHVSFCVFHLIVFFTSFSFQMQPRVICFIICLFFPLFLHPQSQLSLHHSFSSISFTTQSFPQLTHLCNFHNFSSRPQLSWLSRLHFNNVHFMPNQSLSTNCPCGFLSDALIFLPFSSTSTGLVPCVVSNSHPLSILSMPSQSR